MVERKTKANAEGEDKKKRGRRPKQVANQAVEDGTTNMIPYAPVSTTSLSDDENIVVRLNISDDNKALVSANYDSEVDHEEQPYAYNSFEYSSIQKICDDEDICLSYQQTYDTPTANDNLKVVHLLKDFEEKNKNNEWPMNTSIACYWCCHKFETVPFGIPIEYYKDNTGDNEHFRVFGCFCSLECAAAYNFNSKQNPDEIWERYNLINLLSRKIGYKQLVKSAPDKMSLKMFGGFLDINQFRSYCHTSKLVHINFPPMTSMTQQIEEINEYDVNSEIRYIPLDNDRINRYKEKIVFRRPKTSSHDKSVLEHAMNMKIVT